MSTLEIKDTTVTYRQLCNKLEDNVEHFALINVHVEGDEDEMICFTRNVRGHPELKEFILKNVTTSDEHATMDVAICSVFVSVRKIEKVHIENTPVKASSVASLVYCGSLKSLALPNNAYTDEDAIVIAEALCSSQNLHTVDLSDNAFSDIGVKALEVCLDKNTSLRTLILQGNSNMTGGECAKIKAKIVGRSAVVS